MTPLQLFKMAFLAALFFCHINAEGQARSSIGFGGGPAFPIGSGYKVGSTLALQFNVRLSNKVALAPLLGIETIISQNKGRYNGYYFEGSPRGVNLVMLSLPVRYYITERIFATLAPTLYVGGEDAGSSGIGGTVGLGYDLPVDPRNDLELMLHCDRLLVYEHPIVVAGLRLAYKINFHKK
jgi:hypothetical protein